jgi:hypothetical protein
VAVTVTALAMIAAVVFAAERRPGHATASGLPVDWQRRFNVIGAVQCASIALLVLIASTTGLLRLVPASVCLVVGLHFFPLAKVLGMRYRPVGLLLCVVGAVGVVLSSTHGLGASVLLVGTGAALILWGASFRHTSTGLRGGSGSEERRAVGAGGRASCAFVGTRADPSSTHPLRATASTNLAYSTARRMLPGRGGSTDRHGRPRSAAT